MISEAINLSVEEAIIGKESHLRFYACRQVVIMALEEDRAKHSALWYAGFHNSCI